MGTDATCLMHTIFTGSASVLMALFYYGVYNGVSMFADFIMGTQVMGRRRHELVSMVDFDHDDVSIDSCSVSSTEDPNEDACVDIIIGDLSPRLTARSATRAPPCATPTPAIKLERYSANIIWRNVYGLGAGMYILVIVIQFTNDVAVLSATVGFVVNAMREVNFYRFWRSVMTGLCLGIQVAHCGIMAYIVVCSDISLTRRYTVVDAIMSIILPLGMPVVLKSIHKPDNIIETMKLSIPCTCLISLVMVLVSVHNMHPCISEELMRWVASTPSMALKMDVLLIILALPLTTLGSVMTIVGAILQKRSLDVACVMGLVHSVHVWVMHAPKSSNHWSQVAITWSVSCNAILAIYYAVPLVVKKCCEKQVMDLNVC
jgi:hypothetical protein